MIPTTLFNQDDFGATLDFPLGTSEQAIAASMEMAQSAMAAGELARAGGTLKADQLNGSAGNSVSGLDKLVRWFAGLSILALIVFSMYAWLR